MSDTVLVTGASGHLGRFAIEHLINHFDGRIIAGSRDPSKLADLRDRGVEVRRVDFDNAATLAPALSGVDRVLLISTDAHDREGGRAEQHRAMVTAAAHAGVAHLVYTSMPNPEGSSVVFAPDHVATEKAIKESGLPHTILRISWYQENLLFSLPSTLASGKWFTSAGDGRAPYVSREDAGKVAAAVLASGKPLNVTLDVTGDYNWSTDEVAALISSIYETSIEVVQVDDDALLAGLINAGVPSYVAKLQVSVDKNTRLHGIAPATSVVEQITGEKPRSLTTFLELQTASKG